MKGWHSARGFQGGERAGEANRAGHRLGVAHARLGGRESQRHLASAEDRKRRTHLNGVA